MTDFTFQELLAKRELDPSQGRLVRHDWNGRRYWERSQEDFDHFASNQRAGRDSPYNRTDIAYQFVRYGRTEALFIRAHRILDRWAFRDDPERRPTLFFEESPYRDQNPDRELYDLEPILQLDDLSGRVLIDWGAATRTWSQWCRLNAKPMIELRAQATPPSFPGFEEFEALIADLPTLPRAWQDVLSSVGGVYLIVTQEGQQYVGSAYGAGGFFGRWISYAENGHGGNVRLRAAPVFDATVRVLKVMDPASSSALVIGEESRWKTRLGSRAFGLNAN